MPNALITGAGGGIGSATATALAPTHTLLLAGRPPDRPDAVAQRLGATTFPLDLTDGGDIEAACEVVDKLDVLVHNAGCRYPAMWPTRTSTSGVPPSRSTSLDRWSSRWRCCRCYGGPAVRWFSSTPARDATSPRHGFLLGQQVRAARLRRLAAQRRARVAGHHRVSGSHRHRHAAQAHRIRRRKLRPGQVFKAGNRRGRGRQCGGPPPDGHVHEVVLRPARR
ncbi:hypothetical protein MLM_0041 [Mycobacterium lepraemurium]|nr:hypothetical protein MLM_0041 [Mycobacterium lepraemurium]